MEKMPWETHPHIWKTQSAFMSWLRSGIRKSLWSRSPIKLEFIKKNRKMIENPKKGARYKPQIWGGECAICKKDFPQNKLEVDHKIGNHSLKNISDIEGFIMSIVLVGEDDLQTVCLECHKIKTHAEKYGLTFEDAKIEKRIIELCKLPMDEQKVLLKDMPNSNISQRKNGFRYLLESGKIW